jgi:hypothetical protein
MAIILITVIAGKKEERLWYRGCGWVWVCVCVWARRSAMALSTFDIAGAPFLGEASV